MDGRIKKTGGVFASFLTRRYGGEEPRGATHREPEIPEGWPRKLPFRKRPKPYSRAIPWAPTPEGPALQVTPGARDRSRPYELFVAQSVLHEVRQHLITASTDEPFGFLLGQVVYCPWTEAPYVLVDAVRRETQNLPPSDEVDRFRHAWIGATRDARHRREQLVGWYHRHGVLGLRMSEWDLKLQDEFFPEPWQVALIVAASTSGPIGGFIQRSHRARLFRKGMAPFHELIDLDAKRVEGRNASVVDWTNYESGDPVHVIEAQWPDPQTSEGEWLEDSHASDGIVRLTERDEDVDVLEFPKRDRTKEEPEPTTEGTDERGDEPSKPDTSAKRAAKRRDDEVAENSDLEEQRAAVKAAEEAAERAVAEANARAEEEAAARRAAEARLEEERAARQAEAERRAEEAKSARDAEARAQAEEAAAAERALEEKVERREAKKRQRVAARRAARRARQAAAAKAAEEAAAQETAEEETAGAAAAPPADAAPVDAPEGVSDTPARAGYEEGVPIMLVKHDGWRPGRNTVRIAAGVAVLLGAGLGVRALVSGGARGEGTPTLTGGAQTMFQDPPAEFARLENRFRSAVQDFRSQYVTYRRSSSDCTGLAETFREVALSHAGLASYAATHPATNAALAPLQTDYEGARSRYAATGCPAVPLDASTQSTLPIDR
ncbi:MAG: hypothetical protein MJB57_10960 [Gemmatimonadetes bacterium]|nr:hypothetical protein [Gemmatimonadota bacterium]